MIEQEKAKDELINELLELQKKYDSLKEISDKDLSESKQTEKQLVESEKQFKLMFENAPLSYQSLDSNTRLIDVNPAWLKTMRYDREEVIGHYFSEFMTTASATLIETRFPKFLADGEIHDYQFDMVRKDGTVFTVSYEGKIGYDELGHFKQTHCIFEDITKRRQAENTLRESEEKYRFMFNDNPQPNWIYDLETLSFLEVNEAAIIQYGYSKKEFLSMTLKDIRPVEDITSLLKYVELTSNSYNNSGEWRHIKKNGELIFVEMISHSVIFNGRNSRHVLIHDITDRKLAEEALKQANNELEKLYNNLDEAVFSVDVIQNKMLYASIANQTVFGHAPAEFFNNPQLWYEIIVPEDKPIVDAGYPVLFSGKNLSHEYRIVHPNGEIHWIEAKMNPTLDENGKLMRIDGIAYDITHRKQIETELLESEINFRRSISESPVGIRIVSVDGNTIYANKAFLDIYEFNSLEEFTSTPAINRYTPESYVQHQERKKKRKSGDEVFDYEISIICKNEEIKHVKVSRKEVLWNGIKHFQVINLNITKQRNAEEQLRKFASHLQNVREEEKIALAREIHDDLGQILVALKIDMGLLKQKVIKTDTLIGTEDTVAKFDNVLTLIDKTIKTARSIMNGLRPELLELQGFVGATKEYLREFEERHHLSCEFTGDIYNLEMNPQQTLAFFRILQEALTNIVKHARATLVKIQLSKVTNKLIMEIIDNGVGFDKNNSGRQDSYGMIGMKERVILLDGKLNITSEAGQGTCVRVEMPYISKQV